jgi:hypothetical protein
MNSPEAKPDGPAPAYAIAFYALLTLIWCGPILIDPAHIVADVGDPLHMAWTMAWVGRQLLRDPVAVFQANNFHPYANSLAFGDHLLPEALVALPINLTTGNAVLALNLVTALGLFSSALVAYFVVSQMLKSRGAGFLAGSVLAFNGFMQSELLRVNVLHLQGWFLALYFVWRFTQTPTWFNAVGFSISLGLQGLTGTYYAIYSAALAPAFVIAAFVAARRIPSRAECLRLLTPALVVLGLGWMFLSPYRRVAAMSLAQKPIADGADLASFFLPGQDFWIWGGALPHAPRGESSHFLGYVPLLLAGVAVYWLFARGTTSKPARSFLALAAVTMVFLGVLIAAGGFPRLMGSPLGSSPYLYLLTSFPTLRGMATVERAAVMVQIGVALLAAIGVERLVAGRRSTPLAFLLALLAAAEQWTKPGPGFRVPAGSELPEVYRFLATAKGPVVELPVYPDRLIRFRALYPYFSTYHWRRVPIGRASFYPPAHDYFATLLQGFPDEEAIEALRVAGIHDVVVHPRMWASRRAARMNALSGPDFQLLRAFQGDVSVSALALEMGDERVYRLTPRPPLPRPCRPEREIDRTRPSLESSATEGLERIRDGDLGTAWSTVVPQKEGDFIAFHFVEPQELSAIRMAFGTRTSDFPTALRVEAAAVDGAWSPVQPLQTIETVEETLTQLFASDPSASVTIRIPRAQIRSVRLRLGKDPNRPGWNPWSIAEIRFFSDCAESQNP